VIVVEVTRMIAKTLVPKVPFRIIGKVNIKGFRGSPVAAAELSNPLMNSLFQNTSSISSRIPSGYEPNDARRLEIE
jgi:hypothetical protein